MKTVIRHVPIVAGAILALVLFAFLDRVPDDPGVFKERLVHQPSFQAPDLLNTNTKTPFILPSAARLCAIAAGMVHFDVERTAASAGISSLRSAADSSPPFAS